ncbi:hypothetical protein [Kroppenstedtia sanguinis]|uniref:Glycerophosphoryl diester phosphodiesterase membrane domain-containing protein n=1 Tax=Kroppenstedtia sanguinis TaxID=1380684 RepID=A0ABW4C8N5_9BACL
MIESFRLLNQHGAKLWLGSLLTAMTVFVLLVVPLFFLGIMLGDELVSLKDLLQSRITSPESVGAVVTDLGMNVLEKGGWILGYAVGGILLMWLASAFYTAALTGAVREAALEDRVSLGCFFSYGFRNLFRLFVLEILWALIFFVFSAGWGALYLWLHDQTPLLITWGIVGLLLGLIFISSAIHSVVVLFSEGTGVFRSFGYGFRISLVQSGTSLVSLLSSIIVGALAWSIILLVAAFPWLVLQFFEDSTIADIVAIALAPVVIALLGVFPTILSLGVFFRRYLLHIQERIFPEDRMKPVQVNASDPEEEKSPLFTG